MDDSKIKQLIGRGEVQEAFSSFERFVRCCQDAQHELLMIRSRYTSIKDRQLADMAGEAEKTEENRMVFRFLEQMTKFRKEVLAQYFDVDDIEQYLNKFSTRDQLIEKTLELRLRNKHFKWEAKLAEGNSSAIYRLFNPYTNRHAVGMVLKIESLEQTEKSKIVQLAGLRHRNVIKLLDFELDIYPFFIIMDFVHGPTVTEAIEKTGPRPASQAVDWLYQITDATDYLRHKRLLQTNLRPSKIFIDDEWQIMFSPFDLHLNITGKQTFGRYFDVCRYGSPELLQTDGQMIDPDHLNASDQYSIGLIAYLILSGQDLFAGKTVYEVLENRRKFEMDPGYRQEKFEQLKTDTFIQPDGSTYDLVELVKRLLSDRPADRYQSLHELLRELHLLTRAENPGNSLARRCYRRCLELNREFIRDFYTAFHERLPETRQEFSAIGKARQSAMLQLSVDILLDVDEKKELLRQLVQNQKHNRFEPKHFEVFLEVLIETLENNDLQWDEAVAAEWAGIRAKAMAVIKG